MDTSSMAHSAAQPGAALVSFKLPTHQEKRLGTDDGGFAWENALRDWGAPQLHV